MELNTKRFLIASIVLVSLSFITCCSMLIVQFIFKSITYPDIMLSYTSCDSYLQLKHESFSTKIHLVNNLFIFLEIIGQSCLLGISIFEIVKKTEQTLIQIVKSALFKVKYFLLAFSAILCVQLAGNNFNLQRENSLCQNVFQSALIMVILPLGTLVTNLLLIVLLLIVNSTAKSQEGPEIQGISSINANSQMNKLLNKDTKQIRENLLNQQDLQFDGDNFMGYQRGNKFTSFQKIYETKAGNKLNKDKSNSSSKGNDEKQSQRQFEAIEEAELKFDKDRVKEIQKDSIQKFSRMGYEVIERPYLAKTTLSKKFKSGNKDEINDTLGKNIKEHQTQLPSSRPIVEQPKQDEFQIVINMNTAEERQASNFYDQNDLQPIGLDQIYYREFVEQQRKEEERIRQRIAKLRKIHEDKAINGKNSSVPQYQNYLDQDSNQFKVQTNMRQYQSRTHFHSKTPGQLCFHIKKTIKGQLAKNDEMQEQFKDFIRQPVAKQNRKRNTKTVDSGQLRLKKNPLEIIRGKGCSLYS